MAGPLSAFTGDYKISPKIAEFIIAPLDDYGKIDEELGGARILQYFPESIDYNTGVNWSNRAIPGSPLPMYQWVNGSDSTFNLTAIFTRDMSGEIGKDVQEDKYNVDIDAAIAWLKLLCSNDYVELGDAGKVAKAPPVLWIQVAGIEKDKGGTTLGYNKLATASMYSQHGQCSGGGVYCVLTELGVNRTNWFQDGTVRRAEASLSFAEVMQVGQSIYPYGRSDFIDLAKRYKRKPSS